MGLLLVSYKLTEPRSAEFRISSVTGFGAIVLSFFPTARPGTDGRLGCDRIVAARPCTPIQQVLTESGSQVLHVIGTVLFLGGAIGICWVWAVAAEPALSERRAQAVAAAHGVDPALLVTTKRRSRVVYVVSIVVMTAALGFQLAVGFPLHVPYSLLAVELICIAAFGVSWLVESRSLLVALAGRSERARRLAAARLEMAGPDEPDGGGLSAR